MATLTNALESAYGNKKARAELEGQGYIRDPELSGERNEVYYNPTSNKLLMDVAGSRSATDWLVNDPAVALGLTRQTKRFKHAQKTLNKAKMKYEGAVTNITGHSLGGSIVNRLKAPGAKKAVLNAGYNFLEKARKNVKSYRMEGDLVSMFGRGVKTLKNKGGFAKILNPFATHSAAATGKKITVA